MKAAPGDLVAWWDGSALSLAVWCGEEKQRIRLALAGGKETRIRPSRLAFRVERGGKAPGKDAASLAEAAARVEEAGRSIRKAAAEADVALVWDLAREAGEAVAVETLADLALGDGGGAGCAALVTAFLEDGLHFVRKGDVWEPRPPDAVEALRREREAAGRREEEKRQALDALGADGRRPDGLEDNRWWKRYLDALEETAVQDLDASEQARAVAAEALQAAGIRYQRINEGAFRLLRRLGRFDSDDENLPIVRYRLRTDFPEEVLEAAAPAAALRLSREGREDLTGLEMVTIDSAWTRELDDGLTVEQGVGGSLRLGIHIADPDPFLEPDGPVDREALARGLTHYHPDRKLTMLPPSVGEQAASLAPGAERPALSFLVDLSADGEVAGWQVVSSVVRSAARLTYGEADRAVRSGEGPHAAMLRRLDVAAEAREARRLAAGAVQIVSPEVDVRVAEDGGIVLERMEPGSRSRRLVMESMVLAGELAARFCMERSLPAIYRRQPPPDDPEAVAGRVVDDPVEVRKVRMSLRRGEAGTVPGPHFALGLDTYAQATSPLRRYQDLATHRQIRSALAGMEPAFDADRLQRVMATTERAELDARRAEREAERYWLLRYLEGRQHEPLEAVVVEAGSRTVVLLEETLLECPVRSLKSVEEGQPVRLLLVKVNPRADLLVLGPE